MPHTVSLGFVAVALACVAAQAPGDGISKQTYAVTDPQAALTFFAKYLPIHCGDPTSMCNSSDPKCGQKGRGNLCSEYDTTTCSGSGMSSFMFHMVNTSSRPSGPLATVADVEKVFDEKMAAAFANKKYDAFMDFSVAFWASDLDAYIKALTADDVPFMVLRWKDNKNTPYYSLILHGPHTQVVVELITTAQPKAISMNQTVLDPTLRYTSGIFIEMGATVAAVPSNRLRPLAVSKATSNMEVLSEWMENVLFAQREWNVTYSDGVKYSYWNPGFSSMAGKMQVRFVERPPSDTSGSMSVAQLEKIKFAGHKLVADNAANNSANTICGFDKWYDNHYAIDGGSTTLDAWKASFDKRGWPYYQAWGAQLGPENIYVVDPTGDSVQLDGSWRGAAPAGVAGDALGTMCGQGNCLAGQRPTPAECTTAMSLACPGLQNQDSVCSDCVYDNVHWPKLVKAGCLNSDTVGYCIGS